MLEKNYTALAAEIDLIMLHQNELVFIEVKGRMASDYMAALHSIGRKKQANWLRAAQHYVSQYPESYTALRFDLLVIQYHTGRSEWLQDILELDDLVEGYKAW